MSELNLDPTQPLDSVERYTFNPIKGYPMLHWRGKHPFTATQYYPAQLKEVHGRDADGWINKIFWGDNLQVMSHLLKEFRGQVDLVYIDPPFDSKAEYKLKVKTKGKQITNEHSLFEEKQYSDIWTNDEYLQYMYERLILLRELISENGCIYLHCDINRGHYLRCILDEIFGSDNCRNEIVWQRNYARSDSNTYNHIHDSIFFYTKNKNFTWNKQFTPYDQEYIEKFYRYIDEESGRKYASDNLTAAGLRNGSSGMPWRGYDPSKNGNHWKFTIEKLDELDKEGRIHWPDSGGMPRYKRFLDEMSGRPLQSIWTDISFVSGWSSEGTNYPTQKPEALLERILRASSNPGDLVFDCFMGSGTTQAVAMKLGRRFIGADINLGAIQTTTKRLIGVAREIEQRQQELPLTTDGEESISTYYTGFEVYNVNHYDVFRNPVEARDILMRALEIQPLPGNNVYDGEKDGRMVKLMPVNRIATRADLTALITGFDYKTFERRHQEAPGKPVEHLLLVCMGHEPDLAAALEKEVTYKLDVEVVDILRDKSHLEFKRDAEADIAVVGGELHIRQFYPMNLLQKLSLMKENVEDWRELTESVMIDFNYDGAVLEPSVVDVSGKDELVRGRYPVPAGAGTIRVKITDLLSESLEVEVR